MMRRWALLLLVLMGCVVMPGWAIVLRSGDTVTIAQGTSINDDVLVAGGTVIVNGTIVNDLLVAAGTVDVNGDIGGDLIVAGGTVNVNAPVGGSIYLTGGTVNANSTVGRNLAVMGGTVNINQGSTIARDAVVSGGNVVVSGSVERNLRVSASNLSVLGTAVIGGNLVARAASVDIADDATIEGERQIIPVEQEPGESTALSLWALLAFLMLTGIGFYLIGALMLALAPRFAVQTTTMLRRHPWGSLLAGFLTIAAFPAVFLLLLFTVIGIPLAFLLLWLYFIGLLLAPIVVALFIGMLILKRGGNRYVALLIGIAILIVVNLLVGLIPVLGVLVTLVVFSLGLGALLLTLQARTMRPIFPLENGDTEEANAAA